ncbi:hypothetical protein FB451DRAFT_1175127 [Mycena latifolia]|nr:hypothetical protein FB451DRAFT_1175127 [Mycena latifolia]
MTCPTTTPTATLRRRRRLLLLSRQPTSGVPSITAAPLPSSFGFSPSTSPSRSMKTPVRRSSPLFMPLFPPFCHRYSVNYKSYVVGKFKLEYRYPSTSWWFVFSQVNWRMEGLSSIGELGLAWMEWFLSWLRSVPEEWLNYLADNEPDVRNKICLNYIVFPEPEDPPPPAKKARTSKAAPMPPPPPTPKPSIKKSTTVPSSMPMASGSKAATASEGRELCLSKVSGKRKHNELEPTFTAIDEQDDDSDGNDVLEDSVEPSADVKPAANKNIMVDVKQHTKPGATVAAPSLKRMDKLDEKKTAQSIIDALTHRFKDRIKSDSYQFNLNVGPLHPLMYVFKKDKKAPVCDAWSHIIPESLSR